MFRSLRYGCTGMTKVEIQYRPEFLLGLISMTAQVVFILLQRLFSYSLLNLLFTYMIFIYSQLFRPRLVT